MAELPPRLQHLNVHFADVMAAAVSARAAVKGVLAGQRSRPGEPESRERELARYCVATCRAHGVPLEAKTVHAFVSAVWNAATAEADALEPEGMTKHIEREIKKLKRHSTADNM